MNNWWASKFRQYFLYIGACAFMAIAVLRLPPADAESGNENYHADREFNGPEIFGGKKAVALPEEKFVFEDRQQFAPVGESFFVIAADNRCYEATFLMTDNVKVLAVDNGASVAIAKCIYQKKFSTEPAGFSIFVKGGGVCKPTYAETIGDQQKHPQQGLRVVDHPVALYHCTEGTVSQGAVLEKTKPGPEMAAAPEQSPKLTPLRTPAETPALEIKKIAAAVPTPGPAPTLAPTVAPTFAPAAIAAEDASANNHERFHLSRAELAKHKYTIQVAASVDDAEAMQKAEALKRDEFTKVFIFDAEVNGQVYHRVCTGLFDSGKAAREFLASRFKTKSSHRGFVQILPKN